MDNTEKKISSDDLETLALSWLRFDKQFNLICTEDPFRHADSIGTDSSQQCRKMIEIETKISIADLRADLNKRVKHERMGKLHRKEKITDLWLQYQIQNTNRLFKVKLYSFHPLRGVEFSAPVKRGY